MNRNAKLTERKLARALHLRAEWRVLPAAFLALLNAGDEVSSGGGSGGELG